MAKKICIFLNGTIASSKKTSNGALQNYLQTAMYNQQNIITELHANCLEPKINLDGPGTELLHTEPGLLAALASPLTITASLIDGGHGGRGVWANLSKLRAFIKQQSKTLQPGEVLQIEVFGWSRGAYTALLLKNLIQEMRDQDPAFRGLKLSLNISAIDPVPGGPSDRFWLPKIENPKDVDVNTMIYYSDTGDLGTYSHYKSAMRDSRIKQNMPNSIFFSALDDNTDHTRKVLFQASHEAMAGTARGNGECREKYVGDLIAGDVLSLALSRHVHFNPVWQKKILKQGLESIPKYLDTNPQPAQNRKFLDPKNGYRFFGKDLSQVKNLELIGTNPHLTHP